MTSPINIVETVAGTLRTTWVNSGVNPTGICSALWSGSETLVHSVPAISSGDGHFFALHPIPASGNYWLVNRWEAVIASNTYCTNQLVRVYGWEVD